MTEGSTEADRVRRRRLVLQHAAQLTALLVLFAAVFLVMAPWLRAWSTFGFHDWDVQTSHRELVRRGLLQHGELPWWNPFACGGFPAWGYVEGATLLVSPWLPLYLTLPMSVALRLETLGMALIGALGAYVLAGRFTRSYAARALVIALWAVNGRFGLQTAAGHTWHLAYAWMPWCLAFYEGARSAYPSSGYPRHPRRARDLALGAGALAMLVYSGGIYPLPHTALLLGLYATGLAVSERSTRPLVTLAVMGAAGIGLSAPKLLPLLDGFGKAPRLIESTETMDLGAFVQMLISPQQGFSDRPARVSPYGWHEWGMYLGGAGLLVLAVGVALRAGPRERVLKAAGLLFVLLGFGAFHPLAPWTLLHRFLPVFRSQHVPSRFLYPAALILGVVAASALGRILMRHALRRPWLDLVAALAVLALALDIARVAQLPMRSAMWMVLPDRIREGQPFSFSQEPPYQYKRRDWAGPLYPAMLGNTGVINCYGTPPFGRKGARATSDPAYRGEVFVEGRGEAKIVGWTFNTATVEVTGARAGDLLVYNMNYDEGWHSEDGRVVNHDASVALVLPEGAARVRLRYTPPGLGAGLILCAVTVLGLLAFGRREARLRGRAGEAAA
ncbi:hypothetical protein [Chondromyces apiculatus]|uniref:Membrane protein 6-pyruvoyl-tetrahydropterin synthase-related domain-containing protein n=1 Tax=Chondromyces apiculatus DSM 436 TaxID=1192034 RepID=A0A017T0G8_9BACT|nr:hypothetical protein [Chondromyces apiculatus]EYF02487.1 Hypothetical protein CAP_7109 [Chondromyces apiculatus DSM 436]